MRVPAAVGQLSTGQRLRYEWRSTLSGREDVTHFELIVEAVGQADAGASLGVEPALLAAAVERWNEVGEGLHIAMASADRGGAELVVPDGRHTVRLTVSDLDGDEPSSVTAHIPMAFDDASLMRTRDLAMRMRHGCCSSLAWPDAARCAMDLLALPTLLAASPAMLAKLDALPLDRIFDRPNALTWLLGRWQVQFPIWAGERSDNGVVRVPFAVHCGWASCLEGLVEFMPPTGALHWTGGIVGLWLWSPTAPSRRVSLVLVQSDLGAGE